MGLDMRPRPKAKIGYEKEFLELEDILLGKKKQKLTIFDKILFKKPKTKDELLSRYEEIRIEHYETIGAPRIGRDKEANDYIRTTWEKSVPKKLLSFEEYEKSVSKSFEVQDMLDKMSGAPQKILDIRAEWEKYVLEQTSFEEYLKKYTGAYIPSLAKEKEGITIYSSIFGDDETVFRGIFGNCIDLVGEDLIYAAWVSKNAAETLDYGQKLMKATEIIAKENKCEYLKYQLESPNGNQESIEMKIHILYALAKWLIFYGKNGHGYNADY